MPRFLSLVFLALTLGLAGPVRAETVTVFAAASLKSALEDVAEAFEAATGHDVVLSLAGSSILARQISHGAPADLFISANVAWMDWLTEIGAIAPESRIDLLTNRLVLIGHGDRPAQKIGPDLDLAAMLAGGRLAMAMTESVPAGIYGKAALKSLGLWAEVAGNVVQTDNVRTALALVAAGEVALGVVYATDAALAPTVSVIGVFPGDSHPAIVYPAARVAGAGGGGDAFLGFLQGKAAGAIFLRHGFGLAGA